MKKLLLNYACFTTGNDLHVMQDADTWSRTKIKILSISIMLPLLTWLINGYLITTQVLHGTIPEGIVAALVFGLIVYVIERIIIMSISLGPLLKTVRYVMAITMAVISSLTIKVVLFNKDLMHQYALENPVREKTVSVNLELQYKPKLDAAKDLIKGYQYQYNDLMDKAKKEAVGIGSGRKGVGRIVKYYTDQANSVQQNLVVPAQARLDGLEKEIDGKVKQQLKEELDNLGFLTQINILLDMSFKTPAGIFIFTVLFILFFCIECVVLFVKDGLELSPQEKAKLRLIQYG